MFVIFPFMNIFYYSFTFDYRLKIVQYLLNMIQVKLVNLLYFFEKPHFLDCKLVSFKCYHFYCFFFVWILYLFLIGKNDFLLILENFILYFFVLVGFETRKKNVNNNFLLFFIFFYLFSFLKDLFFLSLQISKNQVFWKHLQLLFPQMKSSFLEIGQTKRAGEKQCHFLSAF